jgi:hypothetical protein
LLLELAQLLLELSLSLRGLCLLFRQSELHALFNLTDSSLAIAVRVGESSREVVASVLVGFLP